LNDAHEIQTEVLPRWPGWAGARVETLPGGLINRTYLVEHGGARAVLQRVSPIFSPAIQDNIRAVVERLAAAGLTTPRLVPTEGGALCVPARDGAGVWRLLTHVAGVGFDVVSSPAQARAAGALIARFHAALDGIDHPFAGMRAGVHDTPRHLARLAEAVGAHPGHRLAGEVRALAEEILAAAAALPALPALAPRICHGDLKFNNVLFAGSAPADRERAVCLIDLDTVGPLSLAYELGDAWRSWCNRAGEDVPEAALDLAIFEASLAGYRDGWARPLPAAERDGLLLGVEWVSLELAARFAADALAESYFGWNPARFSGRGEHNLVRARGQWSMHRALVETRGERRGMLGRVG
jgi:Ser/Thr protein kinase RdoA (MazF antagonist)